MEEVLPIFLEFVSKYPVASMIFMVIGILRAVNKPLFSLFRAYVQSTPNPYDDRILDEVEASKLYKSISYFLDLFASVKVGPQK